MFRGEVASFFVGLSISVDPSADGGRLRSWLAMDAGRLQGDSDMCNIDVHLTGRAIPRGKGNVAIATYRGPLDALRRCPFCGEAINGTANTRERMCACRVWQVPDEPNPDTVHVVDYLLTIAECAAALSVSTRTASKRLTAVDWQTSRGAKLYRLSQLGAVDAQRLPEWIPINNRQHRS